MTPPAGRRTTPPSPMGNCCDTSQNFLPTRSTMRVWAENPHLRQSSSCSFVRHSKSNPVSLLPQTGHFSSPSVYTPLIFSPLSKFELVPNLFVRVPVELLFLERHVDQRHIAQHAPLLLLPPVFALRAIVRVVPAV